MRPHVVVQSKSLSHETQHDVHACETLRTKTKHQSAPKDRRKTPHPPSNPGPTRHTSAFSSVRSYIIQSSLRRRRSYGRCANQYSLVIAHRASPASKRHYSSCSGSNEAAAARARVRRASGFCGGGIMAPPSEARCSDMRCRRSRVEASLAFLPASPL